MIVKIFTCLLLIHFAKGYVLQVGKCRLEDSGCMKSSFQKAVPIFMSGIQDLGVEVLDVMKLDFIKFDLSGLQFSLKDGTFQGLKNSVIDSVKWDVKNKKISVKFHTDGILKGHYTAGGRLLILPITGDGQMTLKLKNLRVKMTLSYEVEKGADGKEHFMLKKYDLNYEVKDNAHFTLTNLFNGNKELADPLMLFINENWQQITMEFGGPLINNAAEKLYKNAVKLLEQLPIDEISVVN